MYTVDVRQSCLILDTKSRGVRIIGHSPVVLHQIVKDSEDGGM